VGSSRGYIIEYRAGLDFGRAGWRPIYDGVDRGGEGEPSQPIQGVPLRTRVGALVATLAAPWTYAHQKAFLTSDLTACEHYRRHRKRKGTQLGGASTIHPTGGRTLPCGEDYGLRPGEAKSTNRRGRCHNPARPGNSGGTLTGAGLAATRRSDRASRRRVCHRRHPVILMRCSPRPPSETRRRRTLTRSST